MVLHTHVTSTNTPVHAMQYTGDMAALEEFLRDVTQRDFRVDKVEDEYVTIHYPKIMNTIPVVLACEDPWVVIWTNAEIAVSVLSVSMFEQTFTKLTHWVDAASRASPAAIYKTLVYTNPESLQYHLRRYKLGDIAVRYTTGGVRLQYKSSTSMMVEAAIGDVIVFEPEAIYVGPKDWFDRTYYVTTPEYNTYCTPDTSGVYFNYSRGKEAELARFLTFWLRPTGAVTYIVRPTDKGASVQVGRGSWTVLDGTDVHVECKPDNKHVPAPRKQQIPSIYAPVPAAAPPLPPPAPEPPPRKLTYAYALVEDLAQVLTTFQDNHPEVKLRTTITDSNVSIELQSHDI